MVSNRNGKPGVYDRFGQLFATYFNERFYGHTRECLLTGLANRASTNAIVDPDLKLLAERYPLLPVTWFKRESEGAFTNKARTVSRQIVINTNGVPQVVNIDSPRSEEISKWVIFTLVDGGVAWRFKLNFFPDGRLDRIDEDRFDAVELDSKLGAVFKEVDREVKAEMKNLGISGRFGAVHSYWRLIKEKLDEKGIKWRSPEELNPGRTFD